MKISQWGIEFNWHGDSVLYIWPWKRNRHAGKFISFGLDSVFSSLEEIDELWASYFRDLFEAQEESDSSGPI